MDTLVDGGLKHFFNLIPRSLWTCSNLTCSFFSVMGGKKTHQMETGFQAVAAGGGFIFISLFQPEPWGFMIQFKEHIFESWVAKNHQAVSSCSFSELLRMRMHRRCLSRQVSWQKRMDLHEIKGIEGYPNAKPTRK